VDLNLAFEFVHRFLKRYKAQAGAFSKLSGAKEHIKDLILIFFVNADAVILKLKSGSFLVYTYGDL
jgi:hypothetical protein